MYKTIWKIALKTFKSRKGLTLTEIMIVLVILGGLMAILASQVTQQLAKARVREAKILVFEISKSVDLFYTDCGFFPESLSSLKTKDPNCDAWGPKPYRKSIPKDPWGTEIVYETDGSDYFIMSYGADKQEGGEELNADVFSSEAEE